VTRPHRTRWLAAGLCVAIVAIVAFAPGAGAFDLAVFERPWVLLPDIARAAEDVVPSAHPLPDAPLLALVSSRAPPASPIA